MSPAVRRRRRAALPGVSGPARVQRRAAALLPRLRAGDVAVIDTLDLDRGTAEQMVAIGVAAVVNASASLSGRYPAGGAGVLLAAGVPLLDEVGQDVFAVLADGEAVRVDAEVLYRGDDQLAHGRMLDDEAVQTGLVQARAGLAAQLEAFAASTGQLLARETPLLFDGVGRPQLRTEMSGRPAVLICRGPGWREQLGQLRDYLREHHPVLVAVDSGAEGLAELGMTPDIVLADPDGLPEQVLTAGAEIVVRVPAEGNHPGLAALEERGVSATLFATSLPGPDAAVLLGALSGASLLVGVGMPHGLTELLDGGGPAMSAAVLARLVAADRLVTPEAVSAVHRRRIRLGPLLLIVLAGLAALAVALASTPSGQDALATVQGWWTSIVSWGQGLVSS